MIRLTAIILILLLFLPASAMAQEKLGIRTGAHDEYARIVFDWPARVPYKIERADGKLTLSFEKGASIDAASVKARNLEGLNVISADPLTIEMQIPAQSRVRDFYIGEKVVIDIYDPPGSAKPQTPPQVAEAPKPAPEPEPQPEPEPAEEAQPAEPEPVESAAAEEDAEEPQGALKPHVITITSTKSVGVAAFRNYGELWLVTDEDEYYLKPQINGPNPESFPEFKEGEIEGGKAYATRIPEIAKARGQGGGLLWRLVISDREPPEALDPVRRYTEGDEVRGGTLVWKFTEPGMVLDFTDPVTGETLKIVTTDISKDFAGPARDFIDFETLDSHIGLAIRPKVDDLEVKITPDGVEVTRPNGLALMPQDKLSQARKRGIEDPEERAQAEPERKIAPRIFSFAEWQMGGANAADQNKNLLLAGIYDKPEAKKHQDLMTLARMYLSNARGAESLGFLTYAMEELEGLETNPDFLALRGVANALAWKSEEAFADLSTADLQGFPEVQYWRAYALADLGDWQQAYEILPHDLQSLHDYPRELRTPLSLVLAEVALRGGNVDVGEEFLALADHYKDSLMAHEKASLDYLKGEANRQLGNLEESKKLWYPLTKGGDELYRAKAGLALTRLLYEEGEIDRARAIDNLERLRYAWRGDELEASINYWLGRTYFDGGDFVKGLTVMRDATTYAPGTNLGKRITEDMMAAFTELFLGPELEKVSPLDAVTLYEQFAELTPAGETGDKVVQALAEHLVQADLLDRAGDLLSHQVQHRLTGDEAAKVATRIAAIRLLDRQPGEALKMLDRAASILRGLPDDAAMPARFQEISMLRARAYAQGQKPDQALALLNGMEPNPDVNRLRADLAWQAAYWDDAAEALGDVIIDENFSLTRPLQPEHAALILNRAIALNLGGDRIALANMREKYADAMAATDKARAFEVVTRPRQNATLAARDTLLGMVAEVDLFSDFLNAYRANQTPSN